MHAIVARSAFPSKSFKKHYAQITFLKGSDVVLRGRRKGFCTVPRVSKTLRRESFVACPKTTAGVGRLKGIWTDEFRVAGGNTRDMFIRDVWKPGR